MRKLLADILHTVPNSIGSLWAATSIWDDIADFRAVLQDFVSPDRALEGGVIIKAPRDSFLGREAAPGAHAVCCE